MKCKRVRKLLTAYVDGELAGEFRDSVSLHLAGCESCRRQAEEVKKALAWASAWRDREPSADFLEKLKRRLRVGDDSAEVPRRLWFPGARRTLAYAGAACGMVLIGYLAGVAGLGGKGTDERRPPLAASMSQGAEPAAALAQPVQEADVTRLIAGVQRVKMVFGAKLSDAAKLQLNEVQLALAGRAGPDAEGSLAVVKELQRAEELVQQRRYAEAHHALDWIEENHPEHALASYARMTKILATPQPGYGTELLDRFYAMLLQDTVVDPTEFYAQFTSVPTQITEYGLQRIVESADRLNPVNLLNRLEDSLAGPSESL